jgi:hypothetical protein
MNDVVIGSQKAVKHEANRIDVPDNGRRVETTHTNAVGNAHGWGMPFEARSENFNVVAELHEFFAEVVAVAFRPTILLLKERRYMQYSHALSPTPIP